MLNYRQSALVRFVARRHGLKTETAGHIDESSFGDPQLIKHAAASDVPRGAPYYVRGWAVDLGRKRAPWGIRVEIDGKEVPARLHLHLPRPDVAALFGYPSVLSSGFSAYVGTGSLPVGPHKLTIRAIVGRYGTAFARIPSMIRFFILNQYSAWFDPPIVGKPGAFELDPLPIVASGTVLELTGWALDGQGRPFASVAARIDEHPWNQGWTGVQRSDYGPAAVPKTASTGFQARIRLDTIAAGLHRVRLAGMTLDGKWRALGDSRRLIVTHPRAPLPPWAHPLVDGGEAEITDVDGNRLSRIDVYRLGSAVSFEGSLRRVTPVGKTVSLVAHNGETELHFPTWSAPTPNPKAVLFGGEIPPRALAPAAYRLFVDAPDASQRYVGRADTRCDLVVQRADPPRL